jgi:hypothetical protein
MSGYCDRQMGCVCGGDTYEIRSRCSYWSKDRPVELARLTPSNEFIDCKSDAQLEACNFCLAQAAEARAAQASMQHDIQAIITKFQAGHLGYIGFVEAIAALPYFKKDQA